MSSTKRGGQRSEADFYATPAWCVRRLLEAVRLKSGGVWMDPCAGDGAIVIAAEEEERSGNYADNWALFEIRKECERALIQANPSGASPHIEDFLCEYRSWMQVDVTLTNPPFSLAMEFVKACIPISFHVVFLLRLGFLGSEDRSSFIRETRPDIYVLPNRPAFVKNRHGQLATDSIEYAWFHWHDGSRSKYEILNSTSLEERKHDRKQYEERLHRIGLVAARGGKGEEAREEDRQAQGREG